MLALWLHAYLPVSSIHGGRGLKPDQGHKSVNQAVIGSCLPFDKQLRRAAITKLAY